MEAPIASIDMGGLDIAASDDTLALVGKGNSAV